MVGLKKKKKKGQINMQKSHPKMVNARDVAGESS